MRRLRRPGGGVDGGNRCARTLLALQEALGDELAVRVDDEPSGHLEVRGEHAAGRQPGLRCEAAGPDGVTQAVGQLAMQRDGATGPVQLDEELWTGSGTRFTRNIGS